MESGGQFTLVLFLVFYVNCDQNRTLMMFVSYVTHLLVLFLFNKQATTNSSMSEDFDERKPRFIRTSTRHLEDTRITSYYVAFITVRVSIYFSLTLQPNATFSSTFSNKRYVYERTFLCNKKQKENLGPAFLTFNFYNRN